MSLQGTSYLQLLKMKFITETYWEASVNKTQAYTQQTFELTSFYNTQNVSSAFVTMEQIHKNKTDNNKIWMACHLWPAGDEVTYYKVLGIIYGILCVIGLSGNAINAVVLGRCGLRRLFRQDRSAHVGFIFLAVADALVCLICFPRVFIPDDANDFDTAGFKLYYTLYGTHLAHTFMLMSTLMTIQLAAGRCVIVFDPLKKNLAKYLTGAKTFFVCVCLVVLAVLFSLPEYWTLKPDSVEFGGCVIHFIDQGPLGDSRSMRILSWIRFIFGYTIPFIVLLTCNVILAVRLFQADKERQRLTTDRRIRTNIGNRITPTLMSIIIAYLLLMTPSEILDFIFDSLGSLDNKTNIYILARSLTNILQVTNYAINFALHIGINRGYRRALRRIFRMSSCKEGTIHGSLSSRLSSRNSTTKVFKFMSRRTYEETTRESCRRPSEDTDTRQPCRMVIQSTVPINVKFRFEYSD